MKLVLFNFFTSRLFISMVRSSLFLSVSAHIKNI
ncbi:MAG: hypothetical protein ACI8QQ_002783, partial [Psychroserpens sp.]